MSLNLGFRFVWKAYELFRKQRIGVRNGEEFFWDNYLKRKSHDVTTLLQIIITEIRTLSNTRFMDHFYYPKQFILIILSEWLS